MPKVGGLYTGLDITYGSINSQAGVETIDDLLQDFVDKNAADSVVSLVQMPEFFVTNVLTTPSHGTYDVERPTTLDGYRPRNKKLLTYPYCFLTVDCLNDSKNYKYEFFNARTDAYHCKFNLYGSIAGGDAEISCVPEGYNMNGLTNNYTEELVMSGFPQCAFTIDTYRAWVAQKKDINTAIGIASTGAGGFGSMLGAMGIAATASNPVTAGFAVAGGLLAGATAMAGMIQQNNNAIVESTKGSRVRGSTGISVDTATCAKNFYFKRMSVMGEIAKRIDDFFDRFGYACNKLKIPNRNVRPHWTYTQTKECTIRGEIPVDAMKRICEIYNKGITFWRNGDEVGNYTLINSPEEG